MTYPPHPSQPEGPNQPPAPFQPQGPVQPPQYHATSLNWPPGPPDAPVEPVKRKRRWPIIVGVSVIVVLVLCIVIGAIGALLSPQEKEKPTAADATAAPTTAAAPATPAPEATPAAKATTTAPKPPPPPPAAPHAKISERQWLLIAKNPDRYVGKRYIVYGVVTQFDAATGDDTFRADVGGVKRRPSYGFVDYPSNTLLTGSSTALANLVENDLFTAKVTVVGSYSYDTQIGGNTTVPLLEVDSISVTGSVAG